MYFDGYKMCYDAVLELNRLGCKQIAVIDNNRDMLWSAGSQFFTDGYADALKNVGILRDPHLSLKVPISQAGGHEDL
jgi:DNA-binding LacI/PurR family transcriptional regulator